jgi:hypothetical protein
VICSQTLMTVIANRMCLVCDADGVLDWEVRFRSINVLEMPLVVAPMDCALSFFFFGGGLIGYRG